MATTQYIGARYVPVFADPVEWDSTRQYEPLTIVTYQGASYTSRQYVPAGIEITNDSYWVLSANYNAQVEQYRQEVRDILPYDETPTEGSTKGVTSNGIKKAVDAAVSAETARAKGAEETNATAIANEVTRAKEAEQANATAIANEVTRAKEAEQANATAIANEVTRAKEAEQANATATKNLVISDKVTFQATSETEIQNALTFAKTHFFAPNGSTVINLENNINLTTPLVIPHGTNVVINGQVLAQTTSHGITNILSGNYIENTNNRKYFDVTFSCNSSTGFNVDDYAIVKNIEPIEGNEPFLGFWKIINTTSTSITFRISSISELNTSPKTFTSCTIIKLTNIFTHNMMGCKINNAATLNIKNTGFIGNDIISSNADYGISVGAQTGDGIPSNIITAAGANIYAFNVATAGYFSGFWIGYSSGGYLSECISSGNHDAGIEADTNGAFSLGWTSDNWTILTGNHGGLAATMGSGTWGHKIIASGNAVGIGSTGGAIYAQNSRIRYNYVGCDIKQGAVINLANNCIVDNSTAYDFDWYQGNIFNAGNVLNSKNNIFISNITSLTDDITINDSKMLTDNYITDIFITFTTKAVIPQQPIFFVNDYYSPTLSVFFSNEDPKSLKVAYIENQNITNMIPLEANREFHMHIRAAVKRFLNP